jgi:hypothetical protein
MHSNAENIDFQAKTHRLITVIHAWQACFTQLIALPLTCSSSSSSTHIH